MIANSIVREKDKEKTNIIQAHRRETEASLLYILPHLGCAGRVTQSQLPPGGVRYGAGTVLRGT